MAAASNLVEQNVLNQLFRSGPWTLPTFFHMGLLLNLAGDGDSPGAGTEVSGGSYARVPVARGTLEWAFSAKQPDNRWMTTNNNAITFPAPTATWGLVTHAGIFELAAAGDHYFQSSLAQNLQVNSSDPAPSIPAGALKVYYGGVQTGANKTGVSDYLAEATMNFLFTGNSYPQINFLYLALFTTTPTNGLDNGTEVVGGSYARLLTNRDATTQPFYNAAVNQAPVHLVDNAHNLDFPTPTANWGNVVGCGFYDSSSGGNLLWSGPLVAPVTVNSGVPFGFAAQALANTAA